jgi:hypothetical protein
MIDEFFNQLWTRIGALFDPFYLYVFDGILIIAACVAAAWFFNVLRPVAGAIVFAVIAFLAGFRKGQKKEDDRYRR